MAKTVLDFEKPIIELELKIKEMREVIHDLEISDEINALEERVDELRRSVYSSLTRWQKVQLARHPDRPYTMDFIQFMFDEFIELHGDRHFGDDKALVSGLAKLDEKSVLVIGHQKGRDTKSNLYRNFGMANPEGYRKALRLMKLAEKFEIPIITLIDTPGAYPGIEAEERGQAEAIARNLFEMAQLKVPIIVVIIGEGASGGALGIGIGDRILMLENTWYSVIAPESCSSILWRSWEFKEQAAEALKLTASDLLEYKIIDRIVPEPLGGAHRNPAEIAATLRAVLNDELRLLSKVKPDQLIRDRLKKFSRMTSFQE